MRRLQDSYIHNYYHDGFGALGAVAAGDFVAVEAAQKNEAYKTFGQTVIDKPGLKGVGYPRVSGNYAAKVIDYWRSQARRYTDPNLNRDLISIFGSAAVIDQWLRAVTLLEGPTISALRIHALFLGNQLLPDSETQRLWDVVDPVVIGMGAVRDTPSQWTMLKEAVQEASHDLVQSGPFQAVSNLVTAAKWLGIGLLAYVAYDAVSKRGK